MERLRTFIAITPPEDIRSNIRQIVSGLEATNYPVRWEEPGKEHITLAFLGNITQARMEEASKAVQETALSFQKFMLRTDTISYFYKDSASNDSIIFLTIYDPEKHLKKLHRMLANNLAGYEFSPSTHFSAHITIGRLRRQRHPAEHKKILAQIADIDVTRGHEFEATQLDVYESIRQGTSHRYHLLRSFELLG